MDALRAARDVIILWDMRACPALGVKKVLRFDHSVACLLVSMFILASSLILISGD
jgi:hypothetical protein